MLATYMHEAKITDTRLRRSLWAIGDSQMFLFRQVTDWAEQPYAKEEYCQVSELDFKNSCQEMLAFTLVKAIEDLTARLGPYDPVQWQMSNLK